MSLMLCVSDNWHQCARSNNESKKNQNGIDKEREMHDCSISASCPKWRRRLGSPSTARASQPQQNMMLGSDPVTRTGSSSARYSHVRTGPSSHSK